MKDPAEIKVLDIIRIVDGPIALLPCASLNFYEKCADCTDEATCSIRKLLINVRDNMLPILDTSIADMTKSERLLSDVYRRIFYENGFSGSRIGFGEK